MTTRTHFAFRIDLWTPDGSSIIEHVGLAVQSLCGKGARVIEDSRRTRFASWADKGRQGGR
jgi:hypothetical protein